MENQIQFKKLKKMIIFILHFYDIITQMEVTVLEMRQVTEKGIDIMEI